MFATSPNAKTILFPVEATQLMGTLGGIGELAREVFGDKPPQAAGAQPKGEVTAGAARRRAFPAYRGSRADARTISSPAGLWLIGGVILLIAEIIAPGFFLVFVGAAAIATGVFALLFGLGVAGAARPVRALFARSR